MTPEERIETLFLRFLEKEELSKAEVQELRQFLDRSAENMDAFSASFRIWCALSGDAHASTSGIEAEWERLEHRITSPQKRNSFSFFSLRPALQIAASLLIGIGLGLTAYAIYSGSAVKRSMVQCIEVPLGSRSSIVLTDGSRVTLNAGSKLTVEDNFGIKTREVSLEGEGYFVIAHNPGKVFRVKTARMVVNAYGTTFNVKAYKDEKSAEATLIEGSVSVQMKNKHNNQVFLKPGEQLTLFKKESPGPATMSSNTAVSPSLKPERIIISQDVDTTVYTSWVSNRLLIAAESLESLAVKLERRFDVNIVFEDPSLRELRFTGTIENETIEQVMAAIKLSSVIDFQVDRRDIKLFRKK